VLTDVAHSVKDNQQITVEFLRKGGHVGFVSGRSPWRPDYYGERRAVEFLSPHLGRSVAHIG